MRKLSFPMAIMAIAGLGALHAGCALIAGYDFGKYSERPGEGGGGSASTESSASGVGGGASSMSAGAGGSAAMTVLYSGADQPTSLAVDDDAVYFTAKIDPFQPTAKVLRAAKDGSTLVKLAIAESDPFAITVDPTHAYWFTSPTQGGLIRRAAKAGGGMAETVADAMAIIGGVTLQGQTVYWTTPVSGVLWSMPVVGGSPVQLITGQDGASDIAADADSLYWVNRGKAGQLNGVVMRANLDGSNATPLATGQDFPLRIALDQGHVYWATLDGFALGIDKAGKTPAFTYAFGGIGTPPVTGIAADGEHVYYSRNEDVFRVPINSLSADKLLTDVISPRDLVVDATSVYVAVVGTINKNMVVKLAK